MDTCKCGGTRIANVWATAKDNCELIVSHLGIKSSGYAPSDIGLEGGDCVNVVFCLDCGQLQNFHQISDEQILASAAEMQT